MLTAKSCVASSLSSDVVSEMTAAFDAEFADAFGLPELEAMLTIRPCSCSRLPDFDAYSGATIP